jgi:hypothetical protein
MVKQFGILAPNRQMGFRFMRIARSKGMSIDYKILNDQFILLFDYEPEPWMDEEELENSLEIPDDLQDEIEEIKRQVVEEVKELPEDKKEAKHQPKVSRDSTLLEKFKQIEYLLDGMSEETAPSNDEDENEIENNDE